MQNGDSYEDELGPKYEWLERHWAGPTPGRIAANVSEDVSATTSSASLPAHPVERVTPDLWTLHWRLLQAPPRPEIVVGLFEDQAMTLADFPRTQAYLREHRPPTLIVWDPHDGYMPEGAARAYLRDLTDASSTCSRAATSSSGRNSTRSWRWRATSSRGSTADQLRCVPRVGDTRPDLQARIVAEAPPDGLAAGAHVPASGGGDMPSEDLKSVGPDLILQELHARGDEDGAKAVPEAGAVARLGADGKAARVPELERFPTEDLVGALRDAQKVIYGTDDRDDMFEVTDTAVLRDADSVVALISTDSITDNGDGTSTISGPTFGDQYQLCSSEPFRSQPSIAFCSGFLVDPSLVATAAHCIEQATLADVRFVFGFEMSDATTAETRISNSDIYRGIRIIGRQIGTDGTDWAVVQLNRPVLDHPFVSIRRTGKIADGAAVHVIGHPSGIPKKYAPNAKVRDNTPDRYFVANLDTYGGNSGSPVFNSANHRVEGILVRGETDFVARGNCMVSNVCPANGCRGEDCTRTTQFDRLVPANRRDCIPFSPAECEVRRVGGRWKVVAGDVLLLDFGRRRAGAERALRVITHYGLDTQCFVGRPQPSMEFYLVGGKAPQGAMEGEDSLAFTPAKLEVKRVQQRWKIVQANRSLMDFDAEQDEARQALSFILRYRFNRMCFVGRPDPSMTYFRR